MPQIFRYLRFVFSFLSNEHMPPHVHVSDESDNRNIFDLIISDEIHELNKQFYPTPKKQAKQTLKSKKI